MFFGREHSRDKGEEIASDPDVERQKVWAFLAMCNVRARGLGKWRILVPRLCLLSNMQQLVRE